MADQPEPPSQRQPEPASDDAQARAAYLPIGLVFLILGLSGLFNDSLRFGAMAFLPVGFVFLILALQGRTDDDADGGAAPKGGAPAAASPPGPDAAPDSGPAARDAGGRPAG